MSAPVIKLLESPEDMTLVEELQRAVWPGSETDIVPAHIFITAVHNGGLVIGAFYFRARDVKPSAQRVPAQAADSQG